MKQRTRSSWQSATQALAAGAMLMVAPAAIGASGASTDWQYGLVIYDWLPSVNGEREYGPRGSGGDINVDAGTLSPQGTVQKQLKDNTPGQPL